MIILDINGVLLTVPSDLGSAIMTDATVLSASGYGDDERFEVHHKATVTMRVVDDSKMLDADGSLQKVREEKDKAEAETNKLKSELWREKTFWENRSKAHGLGYTDDSLRKKLSLIAWYGALKLEKQ